MNKKLVFGTMGQANRLLTDHKKIINYAVNKGIKKFHVSSEYKYYKSTCNILKKNFFL
jgi:hypothetical protein